MSNPQQTVIYVPKDFPVGAPISACTAYLPKTQAQARAMYGVEGRRVIVSIEVHELTTPPEQPT